MRFMYVSTIKYTEGNCEKSKKMSAKILASEKDDVMQITEPQPKTNSEIYGSLSP